MNSRAVYLVQTDTTVGFLSQDQEALACIKERPSGKAFLKVIASSTFLPARIPLVHRRGVRHARKVSFAVRGKEAFRWVQDSPHHSFLSRFGWMYSTSANRSGEGFDLPFARSVADVVVAEPLGFKECAPSKIIKLGVRRAVRVR